MNNSSIKRSSILFIGTIILISIYLLREDILGNKVQFAGDARDQFLADKIVIRNSLHKGSLPLWSPFLMSGEPLLAKTQLGVISINSLLDFIMPNVYTTMLVNALIHLIILGIGMYFLARTLNLEPRFALISSIVCMFSSYVTSSIFYVTFQFVGLAFTPYVIMFTIKGIRNKEWIKYGVLAGVFLSLEFLEGAFEVFTFTAMIVVYLLLFHLIGRNFIGRLIKSSLLGIIIIVVAIGISAIKFLPAIENANTSQRQQPYDYETSLGTHITFKDFFPILIDSRSITEPLKHPIKGTGNVEIGVLSAILILISIPNFKKKNYLLFLGLLIFGILMITDSPLVYTLWKYFPYFNKQKHVIKAEFIFLLAASVLTAYGVYYLLSRIKNQKTANFVYVTLVSLLIITSWGATYEVRMKKPYMELESVDIMKYMSQDKEMFRFKAYETNGIDWGTNYYSIYYNLRDIYGYVNLWQLEYLPQFLSVANSQPSKLFGMLNMKYLTSMQELNIEGFKLIKKFEDRLKDCKYDKDTIIDFYNSKNCPDYTHHRKAWGPYLYINERFMPRAYVVENAILILGKREIAKQVAFQFILEQRFNPSNNVIIIGSESINKYNLDELKRYSSIILTEGTIDQNSLGLLKGYKDNGGMLLPDIVNGKNTISNDEIAKMLELFSGNYTVVDYEEINYNHYKAEFSAKAGNFVVLSERFSVYPGWMAKSDSKELEILNANVMNSAVYIGNKEGEIDFVYRPKSFVMGLWITFIVSLICSGYLLWLYMRKYFMKVL